MYTGIGPDRGVLRLFFFPGGAQQPFGPENPLETIDFIDPRGDETPYSPPPGVTPLPVSIHFLVPGVNNMNKLTRVERPRFVVPGYS